MKIEKYLLHLPASIRMASKRMELPRLTTLQLTLLFLIRTHSPVKTIVLFNICKKAELVANYPSLANNVSILTRYGLIEGSDALYSLTYRGRDYLSYIRRYLLHKRL
jgi:hypothetical protein